MFHIVPATEADAPAIQKLLKETWQVTYGAFLSEAVLQEVYERWQSLEFITKQINNPEMYFPLAKEAENLVGVATARMDGSTLALFRLYVYCLHQGKGIGSGLLKEVIAHFPQAEKVQLHVEVGNESAHGFYVKHGFKDVKREIGKIGGVEIEQILMEKKLKS